MSQIASSVGSRRRRGEHSSHCTTFTRLRLANKLIQQGLAAKTDVSVAPISQLVKGGGSMSVRNLKRLLSFFGAALDAVDKVKL